MNNKIFIIAEVGQAHDGSLGILHSYIDALSTTGVDAVKFQIHIAAAESSEFEPFRVSFSYEDKSRFEYWKRMSFTLDQWKEVYNHCHQVGLEFLASPFSLAAVDLLEALGVRRYKIGSGEVTNFLMLEKIARTLKPIILSSGMSSFEDIEKAVNLINHFGNDISILQCTTSYPTPYNRLGLNVISDLQKRFPNCKVGLSEHTGKIYAGIAAAAMGIDVLEFHVVFDRRMFGPDSSSSLLIDEVKTVVEGVRSIEKSLANPIDKSSSDDFKELKEIFEKSLAVNKALKAGHVITFEDLESKKPANMGLPAAEYKNLIGKKLVHDLPQWSYLNPTDIE